MNRRAPLPQLVALLAGGCQITTDWNPEQLGLGHTSQDLRQLETGRSTYALYCAGCHGEKGDGAGPAARFLDPKPRDFRVGRLKFSAVSSGEAPGDEDYHRVLQSGLAGTAMPSFALLSERERAALVAYVKTFREEVESPGTRIAVAQDPFDGDAKGGARAGEKAYHGFAKCWSCHPAYATRAEMTQYNLDAGLPAPEFRPDLYHGEIKDSTWGRPIRAPDFLEDRVKTGITVDGLARVIGAGVGGTAMPTWSGALTPQQLWGLAYYVRDLALLRGTPEADALRARLSSQKEATP